jgi:hypothetical protein
VVNLINYGLNFFFKKKQNLKKKRPKCKTIGSSRGQFEIYTKSYFGLKIYIIHLSVPSLRHKRETRWKTMKERELSA